MEKTNPVLKRTVKKLEEKSRKESIPIWKDVAEMLKKSNRKKNPVNLADLDRHTEDGDTVIVPGKVTGYGKIDKKITVSAFDFSKSARKEIENIGETMTIEEILEKNPQGKDLKIMA